MKNLKLIVLLALALNWSCSSDDIETTPLPSAPETMYFPPIMGNQWETVSAAVLGWDTSNEQQLFDYLAAKGTKSFMVLKKGRIVYEKYFNGQTATDNWIWFSAAKTLTAATIGIAQQEGLLGIDDTMTSHLGTGWTAMTTARENVITIKHHLSMSSGLDETIDWGCFDPSCFQYKADPGTRWTYHQGAYTILQDVVTNAANTPFESYFATKLKNPIGMNGSWFVLNEYHLYKSTARSMSRFGLLMLNGGVWDGNAILTDVNYFEEMTNTSQQMNKSYGYLWWLNGKTSSMSTGSQDVYPGYLIPNAPADMFCALGYADQKIYVVPSKDLVIIRQGQDAGGSNLAGSGFDNILWNKINQVITD